MENTVLAFAGSRYYPGGGWEDFLGYFSSLDQARDAIRNSCHDWGHVVENGDIVERWYTDNQWQPNHGWHLDE